MIRLAWRQCYQSTAGPWGSYAFENKLSFHTFWKRSIQDYFSRTNQPWHTLKWICRVGNSLRIRVTHYNKNKIPNQTDVNDIIDIIKKGLHGWAGHIARFNDNRWTIRVTEWTPREWTRRQGRPKKRWRDNLIRHLGPAWPRIARDRFLGKQFREGFLLTEWKKPWW